MKKNLLIAAIAVLSFAACKKDRTCNCTSTIISSSSTNPNYTYTPEPATTSSIKYTKIKKNSLYAQTCVTQQETRTYNETAFNGTTTVNYVVTQVSKDECTLK